MSLPTNSGVRRNLKHKNLLCVHFGMSKMILHQIVNNSMKSFRPIGFVRPTPRWNSQSWNLSILPRTDNMYNNIVFDDRRVNASSWSRVRLSTLLRNIAFVQCIGPDIENTKLCWCQIMWVTRMKTSSMYLIRVSNAQMCASNNWVYHSQCESFVQSYSLHLY